MGQSLARVVLPPILPPRMGEEEEGEQESHLDIVSYDDDQQQEEEDEVGSQFPDLSSLPPELAINVLRHLDATDLCLASCVWQQLASDNILRQGLCRTQWHYTSIYESDRANHIQYRELYLKLDE